VADAQNRSIDGTGNNVSNPALGSAGTAQMRTMPSAYPDGIGAMAGASRPNPRAISNAMFQQSGSLPDAGGLTNWVWQWGQFIDHDIVFTPTFDAATNPAQAAPIPVPAGDPVFMPGSNISFMRSQMAPGSGVSSPRQQMNGITAWIDGSNVYGSSQSHANSLRSFTGGTLTMVASANGPLLPKDGSGQFLSGDVRAGEQSALTSTHTLFARQHNTWSNQLGAANPSWNDETVFQAARKIVGAQMQIITYNEWLPHLVDATLMSTYAGYQPAVDPTISTEFSTALYRIGHTMLPSNLARMNADGTSLPGGSLALRDAFFDPAPVDADGISPFLKGLASTRMESVDAKMVEDVRSFLFPGPGGLGLDLAALNIQRGRDHGIPDYNSVRQAFGLAPRTSFAQITSDTTVQNQLAALYGSVNDIDVWVGALAEDHAAGAAVGALVQASMLDQFTRLRDADRFWYSIDNDLASVLATLNMTVADLEALKLSDIIRTAGGMTTVQDNVFVIPTPGTLGAVVLGIAGVAGRRRR